MLSHKAEHNLLENFKMIKVANLNYLENGTLTGIRGAFLVEENLEIKGELDLRDGYNPPSEIGMRGWCDEQIADLKNDLCKKDLVDEKTGHWSDEIANKWAKHIENLQAVKQLEDLKDRFGKDQIIEYFNMELED